MHKNCAYYNPELFGAIGEWGETYLLVFVLNTHFSLKLNLIIVVCEASEKKLLIPIEAIHEDLKFPIAELAKNERIRFTGEQTDFYMNKCGTIIDTVLSIEEIQRSSLMSPFLRLIYNEQVQMNSFAKIHLLF